MDGNAEQLRLQMKGDQLSRIKQMITNKRKTELAILYEQGPRVFGNATETERKGWDFSLPDPETYK